VSASAPQLPLQIEDAMRSEESDATDADGGLKIRVNQVCTSSTVSITTGAEPTITAS
jgi:hypothetical protein